MSIFCRLSSLWRDIFRKRRTEQELNEEIRSYLGLLVERKIDQGIDAREALRLSMIELGGSDQIKERVREVSMAHHLETILQDVRYGTRMMVKNPLFSIVAIITLALGIGANTAIFSVVNALLIRPLPYKDPGRLVFISEVNPKRKEEFIPGPHFLDWADESKTLEQVAAYHSDDITLTGAGDSEKVRGTRVTSQFFPMLGTMPVLGRNFLPSEDTPGGEHVAMISHSLWEQRFGSDRNIVGKSIVLDDEGYAVVGVLPADFRFSETIDVWVPFALNTSQEHGNQQISMLNVIARLKPGVTIDQTKAELDAIRDRHAPTKLSGTPAFDGKTRLISLRDKLVGKTRGLLFILLGAVSMTLLIACVNVANLLLSRGAARQKEFSIRTALGAGRFRLVRQMLTESVLLGLAGGVVGLVIAFLLTKVLSVLAAANTFGDISRLTTIDIDFKVLTFTLIISVTTGGLFGLVPALRLSRPDVNDALKEGGHGGAFQRSRLRHALMITEVGLAIVLLIGAGLMIRSFVNLLQVNPGYKADHLLTFRVSLSDLRYQQRSQKVGFYSDVLQRLSSLPGVESAGAINHLPLSDYMIAGWLRVPGRPQASTSNDSPPVPIGIVTPGYFSTIGIPLRSGRFFTDRDGSESQRVIILSEGLARSIFPDEDPLGKQIWAPGGKDNAVVVGVVGDIRHKGLDQDISSQVYVPYMQFAPDSMMMVVHTATDPVTLATSVRDQISSVDKEAPVSEIRTMEDRLSTSVSPRRSNLLLLGVFAGLALALAAIGVYGVIAYVVTQRTHEIGIRMALGARGNDVTRMLIRQGMTVVAIGIVVGLAGAWMLTRVMKSLLFNVSATDPLTFAGVAVVLSAIALLACYIPARRAARVDPMVALRYE